MKGVPVCFSEQNYWGKLLFISFSIHLVFTFYVKPRYPGSACKGWLHTLPVGWPRPLKTNKQKKLTNHCVDTFPLPCILACLAERWHWNPELFTQSGGLVPCLRSDLTNGTSLHQRHLCSSEDLCLCFMPSGNRECKRRAAAESAVQPSCP